MSDTHAFKIIENESIHSGLSINGRGYSEALKISNLKHILVNEFNLIGGSEDCIDCVRGHDLRFEHGILHAGDSRVFITAKGGIDGLYLKDIVLDGKTKWPWDISLGDHTIYHDQGYVPITKNIFIDSVRKKKGKVVILCLDSERPSLKNGNYRVIMVPKWIVKILFNFNKWKNGKK